MPRTSPVYYIDPSSIAITANANGAANDISVYVARGAKIKVFSRQAGIDMEDNVFQEWSLSGRNRRLVDEHVKYTIYARLSKWNKEDGYLVFAPMQLRDGVWIDKYSSVTQEGLSVLYVDKGLKIRVISESHWYVRLGEVSLPENGIRTITFDTGILGTDDFNVNWAISPETLPLRIEIGCVINDEDAGPTPYIDWDKSIILTANLIEGWTGTDIQRFDHWEIRRVTGDEIADSIWGEIEKAADFKTTGSITLNHSRVDDDFNSMVSAMFKIIAWGAPEDEDNTDMVELVSSTINIYAETYEKCELVFSPSIVSFNPQFNIYTPQEGVKINIRAIDQRGYISFLTADQFIGMGYQMRYTLVETEEWGSLLLETTGQQHAKFTLPVTAFASMKSIDVEVVSKDGASISRATVAFVRDGEDSKEREWIFLRTETEVVFGNIDSEYPLPVLISKGQVNPQGAASAIDSNKNQDGWVPAGWYDGMQGSDEKFPYEYGAYRDYEHNTPTANNGHWGYFSTPKLWSKYSQDGVIYRCKWTLAGVEINTLSASAQGTLKSSVPLIATLMKRVGNGEEEKVQWDGAIISLTCEGLHHGHTITSEQHPQLTISNSKNANLISHLNNVALTGLTLTFTSIGGTSFTFSLPKVMDGDNGTFYQRMYQSTNSDTYSGSLPAEYVEGSNGWSTVPTTVSSYSRYRWVTERQSSDGGKTWGSGWSVPQIDTYLAENGTSIDIKGSAVAYYEGTDQEWEDIMEHLGHEFPDGLWLIEDHGELWYKNGSTVSMLSPAEGDTYILRGDNYTWEQDDNEIIDNGTASDGHLFKQKNGEWNDLGKITGENGSDAVIVSLSPEDIIVMQDTTAPYAIDLSQAFTTLSVNKGAVPINNFAVSLGTGTEAPDHCSAVADNNAKRIYVTDIELDENEQYYEKASVTIKVTYDGQTYTKRLNIYCNLLGTWKEAVIGDTKTEIAHKIEYALNGTDDGTIDGYEALGEFKRSANENISTLQKTTKDLEDADKTIHTTISQTAAGIRTELQGVDEKYVSTKSTVDGLESFVKNGEVQSIITQSATDIDLSIRNSLGETGIHIDGSNRYIDLTAAQVKMSDGKTETIVEGGKIKTEFVEAQEINAQQIVAEGIKGQTIDAQNATFKNLNVYGMVHATDGEFTGEVHATSGEFTGTIHATDGEFTGEINATGGKIGDTEILDHQAVYYLLSNLIAFKTGNGNVIKNTRYMAATDAYMDISSSDSISEVALPQYPIGGSLVFIYNRKSSAITIRSRSGNFLELSVTTITLAAGHLFIGFFVRSGASASNRCAIIRQ